MESRVLLIKNRVVYKIESPEGKVYIGQTSNLKARTQCHCLVKEDPKTRLQKSVAKHGWMAHSVSILFEGVCDPREIQKKEQYFIDLYDSANKLTGLNTYTVAGSMPDGHTAEAIRKISNSKIGNKHSLGKKHRVETCMKKSESLLKFRADQRELKAVNKGPVSKTKKPGNSKSVFSELLNKEWTCLREAADDLNYAKSTISNMISGRYKNVFKLRLKDAV